MCFGQLAYRQSLRDVTTILNVLGARSYYMGFRSTVALSTLSDANATRPWQMYQDLAMVLIEQARKLYDQQKAELGKTMQIFALNSTTIDLCFSLIPKAHFLHS